MNNGAVQDIIMNDRYRGAVDSIKGITSVCDSIFAIFISICAFFIISTAILRNVVAGAYAANPKFFNMVAAVKNEAMGKVEGIKGVGPFLKIILKLVPDFKSMSDFADDNVSPKDYFIKAIPQGFAVVMIGVVIYNGFYRDLVGKAANFGSEMITRFITKVDPVAIWDGLTNSIGNPQLETDGDDSLQGKLVQKLTNEAYGQIVSYYTDVSTKEAKANLGSTIEQWVKGQVETSMGDKLTDTETPYKYSVNVDKVYRTPETYGSISTPTTKDPENVFRYIFYAEAKGDFQFESTLHTNEVCYVRFIVELSKDFTKDKNKEGADGGASSGGKGNTTSNNSTGGVTMTASGSVSAGTNSVTVDVSLPANHTNLRAGSTAKITLGTLTRKIEISGSSLIITVNDSDDASAIAKALGKSDKPYGLDGVTCNNEKGSQVKVTQLEIP